MPTIKVRVNPNNHDEVAVWTSDDKWVEPADGYGLATWYATRGIADWPEFELEVPKPKRVSRFGDVVRDQNTGARCINYRVNKWYNLSVGVECVDVNTGAAISDDEHFDVGDYVCNIEDQGGKL